MNSQQRVMTGVSLRGVRRNAAPPLIATAFSLILCSCFPGFGSNNESERAAFAGGSSQNINRSFKSDFLSAYAPARRDTPFSTNTVVEQGFINAAYSTIARRTFGASRGDASPEQLGLPEPPIDPPERALSRFYDALLAISQGKRTAPVTILHLGDGRLADTRFTTDLRERMQGRFGNAGLGLMMPGIFTPDGFKVERGGEWKLADSTLGGEGLYGLTGIRLSSDRPDAWLRYSAVQNHFDWVDLTFATGPGFGTAIVSIDGSARGVPTATPGNAQTSVRIATKGREIVIRPRGDGPVGLLSIATGIENRGIRYSNISLPGASAATFERLNPAFVASDLAKLSPDLIILGYGMEDSFNDDLDLPQFELRFRLFVESLKKSAPNAAILITSPFDAARLPAFASYQGAQLCRSLNAPEVAIYKRLLEQQDDRLQRWHEPPNLDRVRIALRRTASATGAAYWDWYKFMGGPCSMHAWATAGQPLAARDHLTLTKAGIERSSRGLLSEIMNGFDSYQRLLQAKAQEEARAAAEQQQAAAKARTKRAAKRVKAAASAKTKNQ